MSQLELARAQGRIVARGRLLPPGAMRWIVAGSGVFLLTVLYCLVMWHAFPARRTDIGADYAYVSWQVSRGATLYRDVLGQQTPLLYLLGAALYRLWPAAATFAVCALAVRLLTVLGVFALARALRLSPLCTAGASLIYLILPMGFLFDARFEPNILITLGGVVCALLQARVSPRRAALAGIACGLCIMAKLTFAPLTVALGLYLYVARRDFVPRFLVATVATLGACMALGLATTGWDFVDGALLAHVGSTLSWDNLVVSARYVGNVEGLTVLLALVGAAVLWRKEGQRLPAFYLAGSMVTLGATISVGSLAPEMLIAEPAIALCAAVGARHAWAAWRRRRQGTAGRHSRLVALLALPLLIGQVLEARDDAATVQAAQSASGIACVVGALKEAGPASQPVIAPPYAAFLAGRPLVDGVSDTFNWSIRLRRGDATARAQLADTIRRLHAGTVAVVVLSSNETLPSPLRRALDTTYTSRTACPTYTFYTRHAQ